MNLTAEQLHTALAAIEAERIRLHRIRCGTARDFAPATFPTMKLPIQLRAYLRLLGYRASAVVCPVLLSLWLVWDLLCVPVRAICGKSVRSQLEECE